MLELPDLPIWKGSGAADTVHGSDGYARIMQVVWKSMPNRERFLAKRTDGAHVAPVQFDCEASTSSKESFSNYDEFNAWKAKRRNDAMTMDVGIVPELFRRAKCIIFDFDGVLLESESIKEDGFRYLFRERPDKVTEVNRYLSENPSIPRTIRIPALHEVVCGVAPTPAEYESLSEAFSVYVHERVRECPEVPGARALFERLHDSKPLYVSSATPEPELQELCDDRDFSQYFRGIYGAPVTKPEHFAMICAGEGISPKQCLFIGDSPADYKAAQITGMPFLLRRSNVDTDHLDCPRVSDFVAPA